MEDINFNDKTGFIVAFFASLIALRFYSNFFNNLVLNFGLYNYSSVLIFDLMIFFLFLCVYFYAFDYAGVRRTFSFKRIGDYSFSISLVLIPVAILIEIISLFIINVNYIYTNLGNVLAILASIVSVLAGLYSSYMIEKSLNKSYKKQLTSEFDEEIEHSVKKAEELFVQGFYSSAILEVGKLMEINIQRILSQKYNFDSRKISYVAMVEIIMKNNILDPEKLTNLKKIRQMRNQAAHMNISFKRKEALWVINQSKIILKELDNEKNI